MGYDKYDKHVVNGRIVANIYQRYIVELLHIMSRYSFWVAGTSVQLALGFPGLILISVSLTPPPRLQYSRNSGQYATTM